MLFCFGNDAVDFNKTCVETETCGFSETERILHKLVGKIDSMDAKFDAIDAKFDAMDAKFEAKFDTLRDEILDTLRDDILASEKRIHLHLHDQQAVKTQVLREASRTVTICESEGDGSFCFTGAVHFWYQRRSLSVLYRRFDSRLHKSLCKFGCFDMVRVSAGRRFSAKYNRKGSEG